MSKKIGFWSVFALVTGSQIGTGVFMLPASLASFGLYGLAGWIISALGAIALSLVFAYLCSRFPHTGGPHVYVNKSFGSNIAFFIGWTYWVISWVSTTAVVVTSVSYLKFFIGDCAPSTYLILELLLLLAITLLNLRGVKAAGGIELLLTALKFAPLLIISLSSLYFFNLENFTMSKEVTSFSLSQILGQVTLLTFWGFIGLETATTTAESVENPSKTIPKAIILGTSCVALLYFINSLAIMGLINGQDLSVSNAPYVDAAQVIFGGRWDLITSIIAALVCIGTLNAWVLTSGQIALGLAKDGLMPLFFAAKNKNEAPLWGLTVSSLGIVPLLFLTSNHNIATQITSIIDFSVISFLFIYLVCSLALLKLLIVEKNFNFLTIISVLISLIFCLWVVYETALKTLLISALFTISGLPTYLLWYRKKSALAS